MEDFSLVYPLQRSYFRLESGSICQNRQTQPARNDNIPTCRVASSPSTINNSLESFPTFWDFDKRALDRFMLSHIGFLEDISTYPMMAGRAGSMAGITRMVAVPI